MVCLCPVSCSGGTTLLGGERDARSVLAFIESVGTADEGFGTPSDRQVDVW